MLQLLVGKSATVALAAGSDGAGGAAANTLRSCLSTADVLVKAMEQHKKEVFQAWQVTLSMIMHQLLVTKPLNDMAALTP